MRILQLCLSFIPLLIVFHFAVQAVSNKRYNNKRFLSICVIAWIAAFLLLIGIGLFGKSGRTPTEDPYEKFWQESAFSNHPFYSPHVKESAALTPHENRCHPTKRINAGRQDDLSLAGGFHLPPVHAG